MKPRRDLPSIRAKATAAIFVAGIALVILGWPLESGSALELGRSYQLAKLRSLELLLPKAQENGPIRVIIELNTPFEPEGDFLDPTEALAQRQAIRNAQRAVRSQAASTNSEVLHEFKYLPLMTLRVNVSGLEALAANPRIKSIYEEVPVPPLLSESVPLVGADKAWVAGYSGSGQVIAILDTGVESGHEFLTGKVVAEACFSTTDIAVSSITLCPNGLETQTGTGAGANCALEGCDHGTHVAGIAAGRGESFSGVAKDAGIIAIQVFSRFDSDSVCIEGSPCIRTFPTDYIKALEWVYDQRDTYQIAAANMSIGGPDVFGAPCDTHPAKPAIDQLRSVGIASVIASGNDGQVDAISSPACISSAISVGSTDKSDVLSFFSNVASFISLLAPGEPINSSIPGNLFDVKPGTSMAAPHVAGAWAILKSKNPAASVDEVLAALRDTGELIDDLFPGGVQKDMPRIQVDAALSVLAPPTPTPTSTATPTETHTPTPVPSATATEIHTPTPEPTATPTGTHTATALPSATATVTHSPTPAPSHTPIETSTPAFELSPTPSETNTSPPGPSATPTETLTSTPVPSATATETPIPSPTSTQATATATSTPVPGDVNQDGGVNVLDVQLAVNVFLGTETDPGIAGRADINGDETVNVLDVQLIVNIFLEG